MTSSLPSEIVSSKDPQTWLYWYFLIRNVRCDLRKKRKRQMKRSSNSKHRLGNYDHFWIRYQKTTSIEYKVRSWTALILIHLFWKSWWRLSSWKARLRQATWMSTYSFAKISSRNSMTQKTKRWISSAFCWTGAKSNSQKWWSKNKQIDAPESNQWTKPLKSRKT